MMLSCGEVLELHAVLVLSCCYDYMMILGCSGKKSPHVCKSFKTRGGHSNVMELLMLVNEPQKWTLSGIISVVVYLLA